MKGHIRKRSPGHWAIVLDVRDEDSGKRRRKWHSFRGTKGEAETRCAELITQLEGGSYVEAKRTTVAQFMSQWLEHVKSQVGPSTHERYTELARKNIVPLLGTITLSKLKPMQISAAYAKALAEGRRDGKGGLSPRTVHHIHRILRQALQQAVVWQILARNPTDAADPPKVNSASMTTYDIDQTVALMEAFRGTRMFVPTILAVLLGLRRGEIAALRWQNVDLDRAQISVVETAEQTKAGGVRYKPPKNGRGRTVALSATILRELRERRNVQAQELLKLGIGLTGETFVVAQPDGTPLQPRSLTHEWVRLSRKTGLPRIRFHDLRHAHATHMLGSGVHPKVASERLGHSKVGITLDLYSHVLPGMQEDAVSRVDDALRQAKAKRIEGK